MAKKKEDVVIINPIKINTALIRIVGVSPLIVHKWSEKAVKMMEETQQGAGKTKAKEARDPFSEFYNAIYWVKGQPLSETEASFDKAFENGALTGFPLCAIKQCANSAAYRRGWVKNQMQLRGAYFLRGIDDPDMGTIREKPEFRRDMVRIGMGTADVRYRPYYPEWSMQFYLDYDASDSTSTWSLENIINCIEAGGQFVGIGEWRPEKDGDYGRFRIDRNELTLLPEGCRTLDELAGLIK